jgi:SET domain
LKLEIEYVCTDLNNNWAIFYNGQYVIYFSLDATMHIHRKGRFVNDGIDHERNAIPKIIEVDGVPHICLFASRSISASEEIRYDYGVCNLPWRKKREGIDLSIYLLNYHSFLRHQS